MTTGNEFCYEPFERSCRNATFGQTRGNSVFTLLHKHQVWFMRSKRSIPQTAFVEYVELNLRSVKAAVLCVEKKRSIPIFSYNSCVMCGEGEEYSDLQLEQLCYVWRRRGVFRSSVIAAVLCVEKKRSIPIFNSSCVMCGKEEEYSDLQ
ncbi:hypothetical protein Bbelb_099990 [Branchiostoma belcheri]|nr:hypothetical protein Bbelb_099990 [Branchiostoma belcheri]